MNIYIYIYIHVHVTVMCWLFKGRGQVIDAAMVDGAAYLSSFIHKSHHLGIWGGIHWSKREMRAETKIIEMLV